MPDLRPLFSPDSVAIVGASADTHTLRGRTTQFLIAHGYPGRIYPVTRSQPEVFGLRSYATVAELPEAPDLAVVVVPAAYVAPTLEECGRKGVRAAVVISSGFAEERGEAAQERERALREVIDRFGIVVCGPNSEGLVNPLKPLVATFSPVFHDPTQSLFPESRKSRAIAGRRLAYGRLGPFRRGRRCGLPPLRHPARRGSRPHARHGRRLRLLQTAARQPRRGHHRLRRQCRVDVRPARGSRPGIANPRRGSATAADGITALLRFGAEPGRRYGAGDP